MVRPDCSLESLLERQNQSARLVGYLLICSLDSSGVMTGNWRKFQARAVPKSLPDQPSQSTKRVFLVVSDALRQCNPTSPSSRTQSETDTCPNASLFVTEQDTPPQTRSNSIKMVMAGCVSPLLIPHEKQKVQMHLWLAWLCSVLAAVWMIQMGH